VLSHTKQFLWLLCTPFRSLRCGSAGSRTERASSGWLSAPPVCFGMNKLFVGNLDDATSSTDLERIFGEHGQLVSAVVISDRFTGNSRGFGFVEYASGDSAERAVSSLNGSDLRGRALVVSVARDRKPGSRR
jgi:RNA recognition motif-containing protein